MPVAVMAVVLVPGGGGRGAVVAIASAQRGVRRATQPLLVVAACVFDIWCGLCGWQRSCVVLGGGVVVVVVPQCSH